MVRATIIFVAIKCTAAMPATMDVFRIMLDLYACYFRNTHRITETMTLTRIIVVIGM
jgi:hypothetical protein